MVILTSASPMCQPVDGMGDRVERAVGKRTTLDEVLADAVPVLTRIAERLCASSADASDLVQDTIERVIRHGIPDDVQNPRAWLTTMMHNLFVDRCRAAARAPVHEPLSEAEAHEALDNITPLGIDSPEPAWSRVSLDDVRAALDTIDPPYREVYIMHTFDGRSYEDIATQLKISRVTVGTRLTRTRKQLRKVLVKRSGRGTK
jgi:RNA polymerase sigma-70 factor (ECF subfamily)